MIHQTYRIVRGWPTTGALATPFGSEKQLAFDKSHKNMLLTSINTDPQISDTFPKGTQSGEANGHAESP